MKSITEIIDYIKFDIYQKVSQIPYIGELVFLAIVVVFIWLL